MAALGVVAAALRLRGFGTNTGSTGEDFHEMRDQDEGRQVLSIIIAG